jgi:hypothetical protein
VIGAYPPPSMLRLSDNRLFLSYVLSKLEAYSPNYCCLRFFRMGYSSFKFEGDLKLCLKERLPIILSCSCGISMFNECFDNSSKLFCTGLIPLGAAYSMNR